MDFTINYHSYDGDIQYVRIPFKFLDRCPNKCYLMCLLKYKNMYGYNVVDDYLLAWFNDNLTEECGTLSNSLESNGNYVGLWKIQNILCMGVRSDLVNKATRLPRGWEWIKSPNNPQFKILNFRFIDEKFYKIDNDDVGIVTTFNFYNNYFQKICEIKEKEPRKPFRESIADALLLDEKDKQVTKIINKSIRKSKQTFNRLKAFGQEKVRPEDCLLWVQKERKINFIRKINTTEGFWEVYLDNEKIPSRVFNIEGYRLFCTGFPRPFIPPSIENNRWVRLFTSVETVSCTQAYDMWILQSELKDFYKHMISIGKGRPLVECLGLEVDNTPERVRAANIIQQFYKKRRNKNFDYVGFIKRMTSPFRKEEEESDEESEDDWEKNFESHLEDADGFCTVISNKLKKEQSEEEKQLKEDIENAINNNKNIINLKRDLQGINERYNTISNRNNKIKKYITAWKSKKLSIKEERYFHIWWFLSFGQNFFTYYRGDVVGGGGNKASFYNKETAKYLAKGDMEFIFKDTNLRECLNRFQSLVSIIKNTLELYKNKQVAEKVGFDDLSRKQKNKARKNQLFNNKDTLKNDHAYEELGSVMSDSKIDIDNYINASFVSGSYADALKLLKNPPDIRNLCCIKIMKGLKKIVEENDSEIKFHLKNINQIENNIITQKEFIRNEYGQK